MMALRAKKQQIAIENKIEHYPGEKRDRNEALVRDYLDDIPMLELVRKYNIGSARILQILNTYRRKPESETASSSSAEETSA